MSELIARVKHDLLAGTKADSAKLFLIDEISLELNFVVQGNLKGGFDLHVVTAGSDVSEQRTQKVAVKMTPIVSREQLVKMINQNPEAAAATVRDSFGAVVHGEDIEDEILKKIGGGKPPGRIKPPPGLGKSGGGGKTGGGSGGLPGFGIGP